MGIENGKMDAAQISVSSSRSDIFNSTDLSLGNVPSFSLNSMSGWSPFVASKDQWIQVNNYCLLFLYFVNLIVNSVCAPYLGVKRT